MICIFAGYLVRYPLGRFVRERPLSVVAGVFRVAVTLQELHASPLSTARVPGRLRRAEPLEPGVRASAS